MAHDRRIPLYVLLVEDLPDDAELLLLELRRAGYAPRARRVDTEADFLAALDAGYAPGEPWDLILSDYQMPGFTGVRALALLQQRGGDLPFILISGTVGEDIAVEAMKDGAADYLLKDRLARLQHAVSHALEDNRLRLEKRAAERAMRASEQRFRALIENSADGIGVVGKDGRLNYLSPASGRILGFSPDEMLGRNPFDFVHPDDRTQVRTAIRDVLRAPGRSLETEYRLRHADGSWRTIRTSITNLLAEPSVAGVVFNYRDVTTQQQDEQARRQAEEKYRQIFENSVEGIFQSSPDGAYLMANPALARMHGYASPAGLMASVVDLNRQFYADPARRQEFRRLLDQQESISSFESEVYRRDGSTIWVSESARAVRDPAGGLLYYEGTTVDITARRQAEQALRASEERYRRLFDSSPILLWEEDFSEVKRRLDELRRQGVADLRAFLAGHPQVVADCARLVKVVNVNRTTLKRYGASTQEELVRNLDKVFGPETDQGFIDQIVSIAEGQTDYEWEGVNRTLTGEEIFVSLSWSAVPGYEHDLARVIISTVDITARKKHEEALRASERRYRGLFESSPIALWEEDFSQVKQRLEAVRLQGHADMAAYLKDHPEVVAECAALIQIIDVNVSALRLYRAANKSELLGALPQIVIPGANDTFRQELVHISQGRTDYQLEGPFQTLTGERVHVSLSWSALPGHEQTLSRVILSAIDVSERVQAEAKLKQRLAELEAVNRVSVALRSARTQDEILARLANEAVAILGATAGSIWLVDDAREQVRIAHERGWGVRPAPVMLGEGIPGYVVASGQPVAAANLKTDPRVPEDLRADIPAGRGGLCVPIRAAEQVIGALYIQVDLPRQFAPADVDLLTTLAEIAGNAIQRTRLHGQTEQQLSRMTALRSVDQAISSSLDLRVTLNVLLDQATTHLAADAADVLLLNPHRQMLEFAVGRGHRGGEAQRVRMRLGEGRAGRAAYERRLVQVANLRAETDHDPAAAAVTAEGYVAYYGAPLLAKGQIKGVLEVYHRGPLDAGQGWLDFLEALAGQAAIAIDNAALFEGLQRSNLELTLAYDATIAGWSRALDLRDHESEGHTQRLTDMAVRLAALLGVPEAELVHVRRGALLHDIGNMGVPTDILLKRGPLTAEEWGLVRQHPQYAFELLSPIAFLRPALDIPYSHHEKWDGTGYPRQLKGDAIPLPARVFAVVDTWDALLADRPYRPAWPREEALAYLREQAGQHFDPRVVQAFLGQLETAP
jgi:PAS domain S-box-containing protein